MRDEAIHAPGSNDPAARALLTRFAGQSLVAVIAAALAGFGYLASGESSVSPVFPAAGFGVAVAIVYGRRVLPPLFLGLVLADYLNGSPPVLALMMGAAGTVGPWLGAELVRRFVSRLGQPDADATEMVWFLLATAVIATAAAAIVGTTVLYAIGGLPMEDIGFTLLTWWLGDATGVITVAPFVLAWLMPARRRDALVRGRELALLSALTGLVVAVAFGSHGMGIIAASGIHAEVAVIPFLVWGALRFGITGAATIGLVVTAVATGATLAGLGPYGDGTVAAMQGLQFMLAVWIVTTLLLGIITNHKAYLRRQTEAARKQADADAEFVHSIAENLPGAVFRRYMNADGRISYPYMAGRFADEFGLAADTMQHPFDEDASDSSGLRRVVHAQDLAWMHQRLQHSAAELEPLEMELRYVRDDGVVRWARSLSRPYRTEDGGVAWDGILLDVTLEKEQRNRLEYLSRHDPMTGLLNRAGLNELLESALSRAQRQGHSVALCLLDLDGFKAINDRHGHAVGDAVLHVVAERIRESTRLEDIKARLGGDEFVIVQTDVPDRHNVASTCQRLAERLHEPFEHEGHTLRPGVSIGVAVFPGDAEVADDLLIAADHSMYRAKQGANSPVFYTPEMGAEARVQTDLAEDLAGAIERRELTVHYQPQVYVPTGEVAGVEALARWWHPMRGWVSPGQFVPLAEQRGLVSALDMLVLEQVVDDMLDWESRAEFNFPVAVNLSGTSVRDSDHRDRMTRLIHDSGVSAADLELELTETALVHAADERVSDGLRALAALGIRFSADDFGTGYGSLTYLRALPITRIKIDRSFVQGAPTRTEDVEIVRALLQLARNLGLHVIAEGVETRVELDKLTELGCDYVQGYYFARPMSREALEEFVAARGPAPPDDGLLATYVV